ncbi:hypothetical protein BLNAU_12622 [Blattamonas nauphoetae]|uniref:Uncharacterized protein n=1 Tax=Blattamonas nauphoetae TaxID=2049346 RepID=A0ABQ9XQH2_9EUKA|nr:hypothetical protein BLNAU_12622 [Blattamonas nauphoetae]
MDFDNDDPNAALKAKDDQEKKKASEAKKGAKWHTHMFDLGKNCKSMKGCGKLFPQLQICDNYQKLSGKGSTPAGVCFKATFCPCIQEMDNRKLIKKKYKIKENTQGAGLCLQSMFCSWCVVGQDAHEITTQLEKQVQPTHVNE